jgi:hypothetical protein
MEKESINKELQEWLIEHGCPEDTEENEKEQPEEPISGKCDICEARAAKYRCMKCEKVVCPSCFWVMFGLCDQCISPEMMKKIRDSKRDYGIDHIK